MTNKLNAHNLMAALQDGREIALIDVREQSAYGQGHPLLAINIPLSRLELGIRRFIPRLSTRTVILDDNNGMAERAADVMKSAGYTDLSALDGGVAAWESAGYELFLGNYTLTNAFGLHVSEHYGTPSITATELKTRTDSGDNLIILDSRPMGEFSTETLPDSIDVPGSELIYHFYDLVSDPNTTIAVTCGGKTRGTLGCQALINAGVSNPVVAVEHGTMGWALAGLTPERGTIRQASPVSSDAVKWSWKAGRDMAERYGVRRISPQELDLWRDESHERTHYLIDVRTLEEFEEGHLKGAVWIPGGELTGCTEDHLATRNARLCMVDDNEARAVTCAIWLAQMGWPEVAVLEGGITGHSLITGPEPVMALSLTHTIATVVPEDIDLSSTTIMDISDSSSYMRGHIPGAWWTVRSALPEISDQISPSDGCVVLSDNDLLSQRAAADLEALGCGNVAFLPGGMAAWQAAGKPVVQGMEHALVDIRDVYANFGARPGDTPEAIIQTYNNTIVWRDQLLEQFNRDGTVQFLSTF